MRTLSLDCTSTARSTASDYVRGLVRGAPPASRWDWTWRTRTPRRPVDAGWLSFLLLFIVSSTAYDLLQPTIAQSNTESDMERLYLLPENQVITGTVQAVKSGGIEINIGQLEPLVLSENRARDKGIWPVEPGDKLKVVLSNENEPVAYHRADMPGWDIAVKGKLLHSLRGDHDLALLKTDWGTNLPYHVTEYARHKMQHIPVGVSTLFLFDVQGIIVDAATASE